MSVNDTCWIGTAGVAVGAGLPAIVGLAATTTDAVGLDAGEAVAEEDPLPPEHAASTAPANVKATKEGSRLMLVLLTVGFRRVLSLVLMAAALFTVRPAEANAAVACAGADPALVSARVQGTSSDGRVNRYSLAIRVANLGRAKQPSNVLQSVEIYQNDIKLDTKGLPPLRPGQNYSFTYIFQRSIDAGDGTSTLALKLVMRQPSPPGKQDCRAANDTYSVTF